jgi:hypothetical protein
MNKHSVFGSNPSVYPVMIQFNITDEMLSKQALAPYWILVLSGGVCIVGNRNSTIDAHLDMMSVRRKGINLDWYDGSADPFITAWDLSMGSDDVDKMV